MLVVDDLGALEVSDGLDVVALCRHGLKTVGTTKLCRFMTHFAPYNTILLSLLKKEMEHEHEIFIEM